MTGAFVLHLLLFAGTVESAEAEKEMRREKNYSIQFQFINCLLDGG